MWEPLPGFPSHTFRMLETALVLESHRSRARWANGSHFPSLSFPRLDEGPASSLGG